MIEPLASQDPRSTSIEEPALGLRLPQGPLYAHPRRLERSDAVAPLDHYSLFGLPFRTGTSERVAEWILAHALSRSKAARVVSHLNAHNARIVLRDAKLEQGLVDSATLLFEGIAMRSAAYLAGGPVPPDVNGSDLAPLVLRQAARVRMPVFLFGGSQAVLEATRRSLADEHPGLVIAGARQGYIERDDEQHVVAEIVSSGALMVLQSRGFPLQERFALDHRVGLGDRLIWNVGGLFDFLSGAKPRAPRPVRGLRMEWLFRLCREPRRLWSRTVVSAPSILVRGARERFVRPDLEPRDPEGKSQWRRGSPSS